MSEDENSGNEASRKTEGSVAVGFDENKVKESKTQKPILSNSKHRTEVYSGRLDSERNKNSMDLIELGSYLEVVGKIWPISDDYKIVFISSDSSAKENRSISSDSESVSEESRESAGDNSKNLGSDCDWDYFDSSSIIRPAMKDWNGYRSPKGLSGTLIERASPVFSTSDDNSPKFPRRNLSKFSIRDSPISNDTDNSGFSPNLKRKLLGKFQALDSTKYSSGPSGNEDSVNEEKEIEVSDLKSSPPMKNKIISSPNENEREKSGTTEPGPADSKQLEELKKPKKRKKGRKNKKGSLKSEEGAEYIDDSGATVGNEEEKKESEVGEIEDDQNAVVSLERDLFGRAEEKEEVEITNPSPDGVSSSNVSPVEGSVAETPPNSPVVQSKDDVCVTKECLGKLKGKSKKHKNKKKNEKCGGKLDSRSDNSISSASNEFSSTEATGKAGGSDSALDDFTFPTGSFGFQSGNLVSPQPPYPEVLPYNVPYSNVLQNGNTFHNFVPIPVPVLIPVPFPVPTAIWSQNYQNFCFPNFGLNSENFDIFNNLQNLYANNCLNQNLTNSNRNDQKEVSFQTDENNSKGTGNGSIHIRSINMQRPALAIGLMPSLSQGSVNPSASDPTCFETSEQQLTDKESKLIKNESVVNSNEDKEVLFDGEKPTKNPRKKPKKNKKRSRSLTDKSDFEVTRNNENIQNMVVNVEPEIMNNVNSGKDEVDLDLTRIFVEGKTIENKKNDSNIKDDTVVKENNENSRDKSLIDKSEDLTKGNDKKSVIIVDDETCDLVESLLCNIDKKTECSSTSHSEDSDEDHPKKPFRKSYYFNLEETERKTSDDSDIADLSHSEEETKSENSSRGNSSASEDEGNPDSRFSEVYVVNPSKSEIDLSNISDDGKLWEYEMDANLKKEGKKLKEFLPPKNFPLSDNTDSDDGGDSSVVLLKHVKKIPEDDKNIESFNDKGSSEVNGNYTCDEKVPEIIPVNLPTGKIANIEELDLHKPQLLGNEEEARAEDPVTLVKERVELKCGSATVAQKVIVPGSVPVTLLNNNSSEPVFREFESVSGDCFGEKVEVTSSVVEKLNGTHTDLVEKEAVEKEDERFKNLHDGDVNSNAGSEVNNGDLLEKSKPQSNLSAENGKLYDGCLLQNVESLTETKKDVLSNGIENENILFSQLDNVKSAPQENETTNEATKYTSLVMITQDKNDKTKLENELKNSDSVKVIATNTTKVLSNENFTNGVDDVCLKHTNRKNEDNDFDSVKLFSLEDYYTMTLESSRGSTVSPKKPNVIKNMTPLKEEEEVEGDTKEEVQVVTDDKTLSAVICLEEGLADDDSWVEDLDKDRENDFASAATEEDSSSGDDIPIGSCIPVHSDREEELRGYHRGAINFTLHTIVEESCEESEVEDKTKPVETKKQRPMSATDLEKYFYFDIGGGVASNFENQDLDTFSESSSSIYSDGGALDETVGEKKENSNQNQLSTSRLEKYFLNFDRDRREKESDGSVGSDSEGPPSPEQRRKRLFRARASNRLHSSSLDNLVQSENEQQSVDAVLDSEGSSTETDLPDSQSVDKSDDSVKRKKKRKISGGNSNNPLVLQEGSDKKIVDGEVVKESRESLSREHRHKEMKEEIKENQDIDNTKVDHESDDERSKTPLPDFALELGMSRDKQQSRDSGFIGSCDDLLKDQKTGGDSSGSDTKKKGLENTEKLLKDVKDIESMTVTTNRLQSPGMTGSIPPTSNLIRKDSFNNWSSDEETNLMMSKMRQFFKAMVSVPKNSTNKVPESSNPSSPQVKTKGVKPPQLVYFENELTRLMKTVPGIRDDQVREIVEYLSSEDTWSDSYDSSDYTSSDLEGAAYYQRSQLQQEISESCKQIIDKFDQSKTDQDLKPKAPPRRNSSPMNRETALVYQKLVASFNKITNENENPSARPHSSPPLFAKVMHHIGSRLVALMHEVSSNSSGEGSISSHKSRYHKRLSQKLSNVSSTTEEECGLTDESDCKGEETTTFTGQNLPYFHLLHQLPRSKSHDLLLEEGKGKSLRSSSSGVSDIVEEKEASDYERFSWRGSFESALMADSRSKLTLLSSDSHSSTTNLAAKRRSAGDLLFLKSLSREQLDRVRSCGSIGGVAMEDKNIWTTGRDRSGRRRSSVPDAKSPGSGASADGDEDSSDSEIMQERSITLPRNLQSIASSQNTNSLPRLPTTGTVATQSLSKAQSVQHFLPNAKSARYRPPGFNRIIASSPKRTLSAPGLQVPQPSHARRDRRRNQNFSSGNPSLSVGESFYMKKKNLLLRRRSRSGRVL